MRILASAILLLAMLGTAQADESYLIFKKTSAIHWFAPNASIDVFAVDDPLIDGVTCEFSLPNKGGWASFAGLAEQTSDVSIACRQFGPITFKGQASQGDDAVTESRSLFFKHMHISRGCDVRHNVLVYLAYTDKLIDGSPKNSTSSVPIAPWGGAGAIQQCKDFIK